MTNIKKLLKDKKLFHVNSFLKLVGDLSQEQKREVYVVGGFVRDLLMGLPLNDIDLMVVGSGISFAKKLAKKLGVRKVIEFEKFGTAIIPHNQFKIEVATARTEKYEYHSRKPFKIESTNLYGDLIRRDFTINAMAMDLKNSKYGNLHDPFNGIADIENKLLKTPMNPEKTFSEDPLRMMRAAYFASKLGFKIENKCIESIKKQASRIEIVSYERVRDEFIKILRTRKPSVGLILLQKMGLMKIIFPEIDRMYGMSQSSDWRHKDIFDHTLQVVDNAAKLSDKMEIRFAALVHDIAKPNTRRIDEKRGYTFHGHEALGEKMIEKVARRMRLPNRLKNYLKKLTLLHLRPIALVKDTVTDSAIRRLMIIAGDDIDDLMILCRADITTKNQKRVQRYLNNFKKVEVKMKNVLERDAMKKFQSPVRGKEIMVVCNLDEGKKVGIIKQKIENAIIEGKIENTYDSALEYLHEIKANYLN